MNSEENKFSLGFITLCSLVKETYDDLKNYFNLNENEIKLLIIVYTLNPDSVKEISGKLSLSTTLTSKILSTLEDKRLIIRQINKQDKRYEKIILTDEGQRTTSLIIEFIQKSFCERIAGLFNKDGEILIAFSKKISKSLKTQNQLINLN